MNSEHHTTHRESTVDALRGIAVFGMVLAHAIFFFHTSAQSTLTTIQAIANTVVVTIFVFVSGAAASRSLDTYAHLSFRQHTRRTLKYTGFLYLGYILVGITGVLTTKPLFPSGMLSERLIGVLTLTNPINFTEYVPLFILLPLLSIPFRHLYRTSRTSLTVTLFLGALAYTMGVILYPMQFQPIVNVVKELFAGGKEILRFPVLFYYPVYLIGLWWEHTIEHPGFTRKLERKHMLLLTGSLAVMMFSFILSGTYDVPILSPGTRWPPSVGFLSVGLTTVMLLIFLETVISKPGFINRGYQFVVYMGRDAYDLWMTHLLLLFGWRYFIGVQFMSPGPVMFIFVPYFITTIYFSSLTVINAVSYNHFGRVAVAPAESQRFRKRYGVMGILIAVVLTGTLFFNPTPSLYGNVMTKQALNVFDRISNATQATLSIDRNWHVRRGPGTTPITLTLTVREPGTDAPLNVNPETVSLTIGTRHKNVLPDSSTPGSLVYTLKPSDIPAGIHTITANLHSGFTEVKTNPIELTLTEPLLVAWTLDWEGWDASDQALSDLDTIIQNYHIPFTHFINPRTFMPGVLPENRRELLKEYIKKKIATGDESALHLHMQYDLVEAAGVTPKKKIHWGLRSPEGYDVPSTEYTNVEFRKIVSFARDLQISQGFPKPTGYRAGGWFINSGHLQELRDLGFSYDSSGRDKPATGAFRTILWNLPPGAQPYYPYPDDQNIASQRPGGLLEIPDFGTTYELSAEQFIRRINQVYTGRYLTTPKMIVFVSHPQFADREFSKIPTVLNFLNNIAVTSDKGPVVFVTASAIHSLWTSGL